MLLRDSQRPWVVCSRRSVDMTAKSVPKRAFSSVPIIKKKGKGAKLHSKRSAAGGEGILKVRTLASALRAKDSHHVVVEAEIAQVFLFDPGAKVGTNENLV